MNPPLKQSRIRARGDGRANDLKARRRGSANKGHERMSLLLRTHSNSHLASDASMVEPRRTITRVAKPAPVLQRLDEHVTDIARVNAGVDHREVTALSVCHGLPSPSVTDQADQGT